jgi:2',3'-cyclic-nucleotide 2'-phosphodiesterase (5'-nucleotidase family)
MNKKIKFLILLLATAGFYGCGRIYHISQISSSSLEVKGEKIDSGLFRLIHPYREKMNEEMGEVIGVTLTDLTKAQPECNLGNFMADALMTAAKREYGIQPDAAFMNYGGIRLPLIKAGPVTTGRIYELFPFDNLLVLVTIKGEVFQTFLDHIASRGGWPVSGMHMQIRDKKAVNVMIDGKPIQPQKDYVIAIGDYTANGGDDAVMLKGLPQQNKGYLMRDAILSYLHNLQKEGKSLNAVIEKRVTHAE